MDALIESDILEMFRAGNHAGAEKRAEEILAERGVR
jgi:hypothetical protein